MNKLAVLMALAEMAERDASKYPKLARSVLENGAIMRQDILAFSDQIRGILADTPSTGNPPS
ncbi:MAG: hypothetical protein SNJ52_03785 [Verrucomicrobiia bacterium]